MPQSLWAMSVATQRAFRRDVTSPVALATGPSRTPLYVTCPPGLGCGLVYSPQPGSGRGGGGVRAPPFFWVAGEGSFCSVRYE